MPDSSNRSSRGSSSATASDTELWTAIGNADARAWEILVRRYEALVYTIATRAGLSMADASDCFQQTWLLLYKNRKKITQPERLSAWITTTAKREALRQRRRKRSEVDMEALAEIADAQPLADAELESLERRARLEVALERLDRRCRKLLAALFLDPEPRSYEEIARDQKIPRNSMGPVRSRCLGRMKSFIEEDGWE